MDYEKELKVMENLTKEEYLASLRRCVHAAAAPAPGGAKKKKSFFFSGLKPLQFKILKGVCLDHRKSSGFSRGVSKYRGVARYGFF